MLDYLEMYKKICSIIEETESELIKKFILDNIFTIVTDHDNEISNTFRQYCKNGTLKVNERSPQTILLARTASRIDLIKKSFCWIWRSFQRREAIWKPVLTRRAPVLLIYIPNWKYFDLGLPLYRHSKTALGLYPVVIHQTKGEEERLFEGLMQINLSKCSMKWSFLMNALVQLAFTKKAINKEKSSHKNFYQFLFNHLWRNEFVNLLNEYLLRQLFERGKNIKAVFSCIPTTNLGRKLCLIAREFGVPTFSIRRGITFPNVENYFIETDFLFAKGEQEDEIYKAAGLGTRCQIVVVGAPHLPKFKQAEQFKPKGRVRLLFIDQPTSRTCSADCKKALIGILARSVKKCRNLELLIKLHPGTKAEFVNLYEMIFKKEGAQNFQILHPWYDLNKALNEADYVIVRNSTVAFNALIMGKPLIVLGESFFDVELENPFWNERIAYLVPDESSLHETLAKASSKELPTKDNLEIQSFLKRYIDCTGEEALNKIFSFMREVFTST